MLDRRVIRDLEGQVAPSHVYTRPADLAAYAYDAWGASGERHLPDAVVFPASTEEAAGVVSVCAVHRVPIVPRGAGTGYAAGASPSKGGVILSLARLNRILGLETEALRLHAQAGTITGKIHAHAAAAGPVLPARSGLVVDLHHRRQRRVQRGRSAHPPLRRDRRFRCGHHGSPLRRADRSRSARAATPRHPGCSRSSLAQRERSG